MQKNLSEVLQWISEQTRSDIPAREGRSKHGYVDKTTWLTNSSLEPWHWFWAG